MNGPCSAQLILAIQKGAYSQIFNYSQECRRRSSRGRACRLTRATGGSSPLPWSLNVTFRAPFAQLTLFAGTRLQEARLPSPPGLESPSSSRDARDKPPAQRTGRPWAPPHPPGVLCCLPPPLGPPCSSSEVRFDGRHLLNLPTNREVGN